MSWPEASSKDLLCDVGVDGNEPHFTDGEMKALRISGWYKVLELGCNRARPGAPLLSVLCQHPYRTSLHAHTGLSISPLLSQQTLTTVLRIKFFLSHRIFIFLESGREGGRERERQRET